MVILIPVDGTVLGILLPLPSLKYGAFCSAGGRFQCKVKPTSYLLSPPSLQGIIRHSTYKSSKSSEVFSYVLLKTT